MAEYSDQPEGAGETIVVRRRGGARIAGFILLGLFALLLIGLFVLWTQRRPIAENFIARELKRRGVTATYHLDRVGLRTQQISNLVIGDPADPDLVAPLAQVQMRI